ncbi:hypothetical protein N7535_005774 [Penicillium sp. DV-2018c]|nr:hypothetical protein N7461_009349 [Penicillium sp. DV-2018c]KAJ5572114.1 hypothetical protein N7535_005774 [Penicillium sp. DV-2018c]
MDDGFRFEAILETPFTLLGPSNLPLLLKLPLCNILVGWVSPGNPHKMRYTRIAKWDYHVLEAIKGDNTHSSAVFKAQFVQDDATPRIIPEVPEWFVPGTGPASALIKVASSSDRIATKNIQREVLTYRLSGCFRQLYDVINNSTLALEWLDTTLAEVEYRPDIRIYSLIKSLLRAALTSCVVLEEYNYVNTGAGLEGVSNV